MVKPATSPERISAAVQSEAKHTIKGKVRFDSGEGLSAVRLTLKGKGTKASTETGTDGSYEFRGLSAGNYELTVDPSILKFLGVDRRSVSVTVPTTFIPDITLPRPASFDVFTKQIQQLIDAKIVGSTPRATGESISGHLTGSSVGPQFDRLIDSQLAMILGASPRKDPVGLLSQLTSSFEVKQESGREYYSWRPRGSTPSTGSEGGPITGAQATFYQQAQDIQQSAIRLLDAVEPLLLEPDEEEIETLKEDIRSNLSAIVAEFGRAGGALIPRGEVIITNLKDELKQVREALGLPPPGQILPSPPDPIERELDIAEREQIFQNFLLLEEYVSQQLTGAWGLYQKQVKNFKGTILNRLLWLINTLPATVADVCAVMDGVGFGPADRRVTKINPGASLVSTTVEQLLLWIETSASTDWPRRLVEGGTRPNELKTVKAEAAKQEERLEELIGNLHNIILSGGDVIVKPALLELKGALEQIAGIDIT